MTTSRKPPTPPKPRITRPLATQKPAIARPFTDRLMLAIRTEMEKREETIADLARELGQNVNQISEWLGGWRAAPSGERFAELCCYLARRNPKALVGSFATDQAAIRIHRPKGRSKLTELKAALIRDNIPSFPEMNEILGALLDLSPDAIRHIRSGKRWGNGK